MLLVVLILGAIVYSRGNETIKTNTSLNAVKTTTWYQLFPNQKYVSDFTLKAGGSKALQIKSEKDLMVCFNSDVTEEQIAKYSSRTPSSKKYPIMMTQIGADTACSSLIGSGIHFKPIDGEIQLMVTNRSTESFRIVIFLAADNE